MTKIMVVEDDNSLREIYSIRLTAEGFEVVSAADGEEALAVAVREKPDLILSDVMMPKISGFDMLDILRQTPETANIKVIMMTALSSDDQRARGESLGADKYLVKSQVGIEDVINAIREVVNTIQTAPQGQGPASQPAQQPVQNSVQNTPSVNPIPMTPQNPIATQQIQQPTQTTQAQVPQNNPIAIPQNQQEAQNGQFRSTQ